MAQADYKKLKEDFVSGLTGGPILEINIVTLVAPAAILLWSSLQSRHSFFTPSSPLNLFLDYAINVVTILLSVTLYSNFPILLVLFLFTSALLVHIVPASIQSRDHGHTSTASPLALKPFLTAYRGSMLVTTCIAILAVDFPLFPRRFAKVETWGTSLMDLGVGSFVFSAGVVAARPLLKERLGAVVAGEKKKQAVTAKSLASRLLDSIRHSLPLLALGFIRLLSVKGLDYAEHVTEYGVHWNFFFTLAFLPPFVALFQSALTWIPSLEVLALLLASAYQVTLDITPLKSFILAAPRVDLLSQNREGIFSFLGYLAIFLAGQGTGFTVLPRAATPADHRKLLRTLAFYAAGWCLLYAAATNYTYGLGLSVSRRLANLPYVLWTAAFNVTQLLICALVERWTLPSSTTPSPSNSKSRNKTKSGSLSEQDVHDFSTSRVLRAFNRNGLVLFLLANLLTGLVNLTVPTLHTGLYTTIAILLAYSGLLTVAALFLDFRNWSIKL